MGSKSFSFQSDSARTLDIVVNSIYTNKEVFLREILSNASDACNKLRYISLSNTEILEDNHVFEITVSFNKEAKTITIRDTGIGMDEIDLINNIGTIANSGTKKFALEMQNDSDQTQDAMIGQFGVGFYSVFMVSDRVSLKTRKSGDSTVRIWESDGKDGFSIEEVIDNSFQVGTEITMHIRDSEEDFLNKFRLEHVITSYSDCIDFPIKLVDENGNTEQVNSSSAIWLRSKNEISDEEHTKFFNSIAHVGGTPWAIIHNKNEGRVEFTNLLYIPNIKPFDLFHPDRKCSVKLYVKRVFITDENVDIVPKHMRFLKGVVDCPDLPLNISRETLQNNNIISHIKKSVTNKVINELKKSAEKDEGKYCSEFFANFGSVLKEGLCEALPTDEREKLMQVCRFFSIKNDCMISIDTYVESMLEGQKTIFYLTANSIEIAKNSPQIEGFISKDLDVLVLIDAVDDFWTSVVQQYKDISMQSITRSDIDLDCFAKKDSDNGDACENKVDSDSDQIADVLSFFKDVLKDDVADVIASKKLHHTPACLSIGEGAMGMKMERFMREQKQLNYRSKKNLEINIKHPLILSLIDMSNVEKKEKIVKLLFFQSCIAEGEEIDNLQEFISSMTEIMSDAII